MYALANCVVYTGASIKHEKAVLIDGDAIRGVVDVEEIPRQIEVKDLGGLSVAPGFVDIQVNGGGGVLFQNEPNADGIERIAAAHRRFGTTDLLPTYISGPTEDMAEAAKAVQTCIDRRLPGVLGVHFEGPFIAEAKSGVHSRKFVRPPSDRDLAVVRSVTGGITLLTVAPEVMPPGLIRELSAERIRVSVGHTNADYDTVIKAFDDGAASATHLFNAMSGFESRAPGTVGAALDHKDAWVGIIVDGFHVDFAVVRLAVRAKGQTDKVILVTDAMPPVGGDSATFQLNGRDITVIEGRCTTEDGVLAGSTLDMATAVRNCVQKVGLPKDEALRMASTYPAEFLGLSRHIGFVAPGWRANLAIFDDQIEVSATIVSGIYREAGAM